MTVCSKDEMVPEIFWVGAIDWSVRNFHGYTTDEGSSYNAYLIMDEEPTLIDTVKAEFADQMVERIRSIIPLSKIKYIVMNHGENDHSGALPTLVRLMPQLVIITNEICHQTLLALYPPLKTAKFQITHELKLKTHSLIFQQIPMVHWPDSMITFCPEKRVVFSNDGFGQHIACSERWSDQLIIDHVMLLAKEYMANILGLCQVPIVQALKHVVKLQFDFVLTAHGLSWRNEHIGTIVKEYALFSENKQMKKKLTIYFCSLYGSIKAVAEQICQASKYPTQLLDLKVTNITKCALNAYDSEFLAFGCYTYNGGMNPDMESLIQYLAGLHLIRNRKVYVFGSFCYADKAVKQMIDLITKAGGIVVGKQLYKLKADPECMYDMEDDIRKLFD
ncbi:A-type_flavoprotein [Hexamita inflata]|uniref:A-type flavoprotein n=1 Tax=Hexamita inflata TaxID=28002 RepID=A0AA86PTL9_9EUKA|nr:A-type flavoprotein [Hexamita inflata]